ncbi:Ras family GTPase [uncultured virus]|nr:Ras family GTPase [uncultured virus]
MTNYGYDYIIRIAIIGDSTVGKSSLLENYMDGTITPNIMTTIGIDMRIKRMVIDDKIVKVQIWDTAGQERFRVITSSYYRVATAVLLVYAVDDIFSFEHVTSWYQDLQKHCTPNIPIVLIGNKSDLNRKQVVTTEMGQSFADKLQIPFFETSAKDSRNVSIAFDHLIDIKFKQLCDEPQIERHSIKLEPTTTICIPRGRCI